MLPEENQRKGVISASLGNHAQALSFHGYKLGINVIVVMPIVAPIMKIQKCREYNATVVVKGKNMAESKKIAMSLAKQKGYTYINGWVFLFLSFFSSLVTWKILFSVTTILT